MFIFHNLMGRSTFGKKVIHFVYIINVFFKKMHDIFPKELTCTRSKFYFPNSLRAWETEYHVYENICWNYQQILLISDTIQWILATLVSYWLCCQFIRYYQRSKQLLVVKTQMQKHKIHRRKLLNMPLSACLL